MNNRRRYLHIAAVMLLSTAIPSWSAVQRPPSRSPSVPAQRPSVPALSSSLSIRVEDGFLTLQTRNTPLRDILQQIASQVGVEIVVYGAVEQLVSGDFNRTFIEEVLRRITQDFNSVFLYKAQTGGQGSPQPMEKVLLYANEVTASKGNAPPVVFRPGSGPAPEKVARQPSLPDTEEPEVEAEESGQLSMDSINEMVKSKDSDVREEAVGLLADLEDGSGIELLSEMLRTDKEESIRRLAAEVLGNLGDQQAVQALGQALSDRSAEVRSTAVYALGQMAGEEVIALLKKAKKDVNEEVRQAATESLEMALENAGAEE
jgi:hypothetical protein